MTGTTIRKSSRGFLAALPLLLAGLAPAMAQYAPSTSPMTSTRNPTCLRYESQLASLDRGTFDPTRAAEIKRWEDQAGKQQGELDRLGQQAAKMGCQGGGFFALFSGQPAQCGPLNNQIQQTRSNLDRIMGEIQRLQGNSADREGQRRSILMALGQNDCGAQYRRYANQGPGHLLRESVRHPDLAERRRRTVVGHVSHALRPHLRRLLLPDFLSRRCRASSPTTSNCASGSVRRARPCSTPTATRARTSPARCRRPPAGTTPSFPTPSPTARPSTTPAVAGCRDSPGPMRCGNSTTRPSNAATSSCRPKSRPRRCRSRASMRRAGRSGPKPSRAGVCPAGGVPRGSANVTPVQAAPLPAVTPAPCDRGGAGAARSQAPGAHGRADLSAGPVRFHAFNRV